MNNLGKLKAWFVAWGIGGWLALLPLFFPFYLVKFDLVGLPFNVLEGVIVVTFLFWLGVTIYNTVQSLNKVEDWKFVVGQLFLRNWKFLLTSGLFLLVGLVGVLIVPKSTVLIDAQIVYESKKVAWGILKGWIVIPYLYFVMLWFVIGHKLNNRKFLFNSLYAYVFSALPLVIWAFSQYFTGNFITPDGRASGPFVNANYLAMYLAPAVVALWILIVRGILLGFKLPKFLIGAFLAVFYVIALLMTQSYGAMFGVGVSLVFFLICSWILHKRFNKSYELGLLKYVGYFLCVMAGIALLSAGLLFLKTDKWRLFTELQARSSNSVRLEVYDVAWVLIKQSPVIGIGFGQFEPLYNLRAPEILGHAPYEWVMIHPHNTLLSIWLNMGVAGLLMFLWLILVVFKNYWETACYEEKFYRLIGLSMLLAMLLHGMVDTYLFKNDLAMVFWLIVALCLLPRKMELIGTVVEGAKMGRKIGFPTANLKIDQVNFDLTEFEYGVYGAKVWLNGQKYVGAISYGLRPTIDDSGQATFEVYLIDFDEDIYGQILKVEIILRVRSIVKFKDLDELKSNIENDVKLIESKIRI